MKDSYGRTVDYMRVSVTDTCNLRCDYCMPQCSQPLPKTEILTLNEISRVCAEAAKLGIGKIKLTGGEPLLRRGIVDLIYKLKSTDGINTVTLTTNGVFAEDFAEELGYAGIDRVNVSLDTLNRETFYKITGVDCLDKVLRGIEALLKCDIPVRTNTVLRKGINDGDYGDIIAVAKAADIDVRFIEMMPIGEGCKYEAVPNTYIMERLGEHLKKIDKKGNGPAEYYAIDGFKGNIGFISPMSSSFCKNCSRIRLTSNGYLKGCLCYNDGISIRDIVRNGSNTQIMEAISSVILNKPECHCFSDVSKITEKKGMNKIGG